MVVVFLSKVVKYKLEICLMFTRLVDLTEIGLV
jgi:hypothetical protein